MNIYHSALGEILEIFSGKMTILSYITIFGPIFSAILENLWELFLAMSQKLRFWPNMVIFGLIWPNLAPKTNFLGQNDYSIL